ncbi:hypothetical protein JCGZ_15375 [Jatropha curcas]|uniref:TYRAAT2-like C-terminal domain-containing protein n=1 Tax=Jatropha curcas TaxID=180498 RepID=A0A067K676_JATCU|nr:hypothetical protein JCGZ_15375 [Jatropha curcas]
MLEMSCQDQDKYAAGSQFITHTVGRVLKMLKLESTPINTKGYESLLDLGENTAGDSFDLYYGLFMYKKNALKMLERLDLAFESLRKQLFGRLHEAVRKQLFGNGERGHVVQLNYVNGHGNGTALTSAAKAERLGSDVTRVSRRKQFLDIFAREGCRMVEMSCAEHDWHAAGSQFITHTMGRVLEKLGLGSAPINTKGYETLLNLVENTVGDSFDLYYGLFMYNANAMEQLERLDLAFERLKKQLFGRLPGVLRKQLFENAEKSQVLMVDALASELPQNDVAPASSLEILNI